MPRPKLPNSLKKEKLNLTVSHEVKEMLDYIRIEKNISISMFLEESVMKEYKKLQKSIKIPGMQMPGQMNLHDINGNTDFKVFKGKNVDIRPHDLKDGTYMLCRTGTREPLQIGTYEQILEKYDEMNR
ncbi:hypothetical protein DWY88_18425 [Mediterraneibacter gnavus]|uniref:Uncharacterized protein n=1 Tax=Mediterraneibacter gnavus TaxID=33038 RepID=A0A412BM66_MEDGN|nr:hypothetical protein [Mediterraneibacter gnavus]RGQ56972.1 hypothetical protein DWY88_18425 [Mediterraneibacter gnavus]